MPRHLFLCSAALLTLSAPSVFAQDTSGPYYAYARQLLAAEQASPGGEIAGLPQRLADIEPPADLDSLHRTLIDRATRWAQLAPRAEPVPVSGVSPCLGRNPAASSDCTGPNVRHTTTYDRARADAGSAGNQYTMVRRRIIERLRAAGVRFRDRHGSILAPPT